MANDLIVVQSGVSVDRIDVMDWFKAVNLEQARDVFHVVEGILEMRRLTVPKRKRRDLDPGSQGLPEGMTVHSAPRRSEVK